MFWRRLRGAVLLLPLALALVLAERWPATGDPLPPVRHVVVVTTPGLSLQHLRDGRLPNLSAAGGAVAAMSARAEHARPGPAEGYLAMGSGVRTGSLPGVGLGPLPVARPLACPRAGRATPGCNARGRARVLAIDELRAADRARHLGSAPGALGSALRAAGRDIVITGHSDGPAALVAMDRDGLLTTARGPLARLARGHDVVIAAATSAPAADRLLARPLPADTRVMLISPSPAPGGQQLTLAAVLGEGIPRGSLVSESTRRAALVTLGDVAPTILAALGIPRPAGMVGRPLRTRAESPDLGRLIDLDARSATQASAYRPSVLLLGCVLLALGALALHGSGRTVTGLALGVAALPLATYLLRLVPNQSSTAAVVALTLLVAAAIAGLALALRRGPLTALTAILVATAAVLGIDGATGGWLHQTTMLGYSLPGGGRFYGMPNSTFALLAGATVLAAGLFVERHGPAVLPAVAIVFAVVALLNCLPGLGSDVGGLMTLTPVFGLAWLGLAGRRLRPRHVAALAGAAVLLLVALVAVDLLRPDASRTHLGRLVAGIERDGTGPLWDAIVRKESANLRLLVFSPWTGPLVAALVVPFALRTSLSPALRAAVVANLVLAGVGFAFNDSGAIVIVLALIYLGPLLAILRSGDGLVTGPPALALAAGPRRASPG